MKHTKLLILLALLVLALTALAVPVAVFFSRPPVLVVTDIPFANLYGENRIRQQQRSAMITLFRQVKPVLIADGASPDLLVFTITEAASLPFCVLFPVTQTQAARRYHEQFPEIPVIIFAGTSSGSGMPVPDGILCVYTTDRELDLYRAGTFAGIIGSQASVSGGENTEKRTYALWQERSLQAAGRDIFLQGLQEQDSDAAVIFVSSIGEISGGNRISCAVLTTAGAEYFEQNHRIPAILFTWLNPVFIAREVVIIFDDSPWALLIPAVRMMANGQAEGKIPSRPLVLSEKITDNMVSQMLEKSAKKTLQQTKEFIKID